MKSSKFSVVFPATFQIIKKLLPKKAVEVLKFISAKNVRQYIDEDNMPISWGGKDNYEFSFKPENLASNSTNGKIILTNGKTNHQMNNNNNNDSQLENLNLLHKKVSEHF